MFLGYPDGVKCYKLWCIKNGKEKVVIIKDVTFHESIFPFLSKLISCANMRAIIKGKYEERI